MKSSRGKFNAILNYRGQNETTLITYYAGIYKLTKFLVLNDTLCKMLVRKDEDL